MDHRVPLALRYPIRGGCCGSAPPRSDPGDILIREAETHKYGLAVRMVLPLSEGYAIFNAARELQFICTGDALEGAIIASSSPALPAPRAKPNADALLSELGL